MRTESIKLKKILFPLIAVLMPLILILTAAELVTRRLDPEIRLQDGLRNPFWAPHQTRHHALRPGEYSDTIWGISFHVNSLGFRGPEVTREKPRKTIRIICMGDSITMGSALPDEATYPRVLDDMLSERYPAGNFEVLNAGISGYDIREEYLQLKEDCLPLSPDAVVLQFCLNDLPGVVFADLINPNRDINIPGKNLLLERSALARFAKERYNRIGLKNDFLGLADVLEMKPESPHAMRIEAGWREYEEKLGEMALLCSERGIGFLLLIVPHQAQFEDRNKRFIPQKRLAEFAHENRIDLIDLVPLFSSQDDPPYSHPDPVHPDPKGHRIIAAAVMQWLEDSSLIYKKN